ncbi:cell division protein FtsK, partial [Streptomyces mirabilis]
MKHPDDDNELFNRLEAEMTDPDTPSGGEVVDLGKARTARGESPDPTPDPWARAPPAGGAAPGARGVGGRWAARGDTQQAAQRGP